MPTTYPTRRHAMIVASVKPDADTVLLTIDHDARASYSRAVDPRAMAAMRDHVRGGERWQLVDVDRDQDSPHGDTYGRSVFRFERQS